eukprot:gene4565-5162_t
MTNLSCGVFIEDQKSFYLLNHNCTRPLTNVSIPVTALLFFIESFVSALLGFAIYWKYNSISILNLRICIAAISNTWWIIYFIFLGLRSILNCIRYSLGQPREGFFLSDWVLATVEVLILCFGLNYQRKYRSSAQINDEIDQYTKSATRNNRANMKQAVLRTVASSGSLLSLVAFVIFIAIVMFAVVGSNTIKWFWIYFGFSSLFHFISLLLVFIIMFKTISDGPSIYMKFLLFSAVLLMIPSDFPMFIWRNCFDISCICGFFTLFDLFVLMKIISFFLLFFAVRSEFLRLQQECQWAMLNEVQKFSF